MIIRAGAATSLLIPSAHAGAEEAGDVGVLDGVVLVPAVEEVRWKLVESVSPIPVCKPIIDAAIFRTCGNTYG